MKSSHVMQEQDINVIIELIKTNPNHKQIIQARQHGKGSELYETIKFEQPTFSPNACFSGKRSSKHIKSLTGLIYLDFDKSINPSIFKSIPFIFASWISFGGDGHGVLVSVKDLTTSNFNSVWHFLSNYFKKLNLTVDPLTKDITRQNVISYDPDIYLNLNCIELEALQILPYQTNTTFSRNNIFSASTFTQDHPSNHLFDSTSDLLARIKYKTTLSDYHGQDFIIIEEGIPSRDAYLPMEITDGKRNKCLKNFTMDIMFNNPRISFDQLKLELLKVNNYRCKPQLPVHEVIKIVEWCYNTFSPDPLSMPFRLKKIHINPDAGLSTKQKRVIVGQQVGFLRRNKTIDELTGIYIKLEETENQINPKLLEKHSSVKLRTIQKYWIEIKESALRHKTSKREDITDEMHKTNKEE